MHARTYFQLNISVKRWPANLLCKCFKGHKNVLRGEFELIHLVWYLRKSQSALRGAGSVIILWYNQKRCVDLLWGWESQTWLQRQRHSCTPSPHAACQCSAATRHHHMLGWGGVKSLERWNRRLSQSLSSVCSQNTKGKNLVLAQKMLENGTNVTEEEFASLSYGLHFRFVDNRTRIYLLNL